MGSCCSSCSRDRNKYQLSNKGYSSTSSYSYRSEPYKRSTYSTYSKPYKSYSDSTFGSSWYDAAINSAPTYSSDENHCSSSSHNNHHDHTSHNNHDTYSSNHDCGSNDF